MAQQTERIAAASEQDTSGTVRRRGLIAGAAALAAGLLARQAMEPQGVEAADGNFLQLGHRFDANNTCTLETGLFYNNASGPADGAILLISDSSTPTVNSSAIGGHAVSGSVLNGVTGRTFRPGGSGVFGEADGGASSTSSGVYGFSDVGTGVTGSTQGIYGVYGASSKVGGAGVGGTVTGGYGVIGTAGDGYGVLGQSTTGNGVFGFSQQRHAVAAQTTGPGYGSVFGLATTAGTAGIYGSTFNGATNVGTAYAGYFDGNLVAVHGAKSAAVPHKDGSYRLVYCMESPECWFEDFGKGNLAGGKAAVTLDADFAAIVHTDDYMVFLTETGSHTHLAVTAQTATGFTVEADTEIAATKGKKPSDLNGSFAYRVVARRKDVDLKRLATFDLPRNKNAATLTPPQPPKPLEIKK